MKAARYEAAVIAATLFVLLAASVAVMASAEPVVQDAGDSVFSQSAAVVNQDQILRGRRLVIIRDCGGCHGGGDDPGAPGWLAGVAEGPIFEAEGFPMWARNLTPDGETGLGRVSERQIFNALKYGLSPRETPDVTITSQTPGEGNFPADPHYLAPGMPWRVFRYMDDRDLRDIAAYLKHALRPVENRIEPGERPEDGWAGISSVEVVGPPAMPPFPTDNEREPALDKRDQVLRGRKIVATSGCSGCHGGVTHPGQPGWLAGARSDEFEFDIGPFKTRARNLTPHNTTGLGRFSETQIFNSLRYGLRPGETADEIITSMHPGEGRHPKSPKYLAPPMPWMAWRHLDDEEIADVAAYLKHGVRPVEKFIEDSEGPPDFWEGEYAPKLAAWPSRPFPTENEIAPATD